MSFADWMAYSLLHDPLLTIAISVMGGIAVGVFASMLTMWDRGNK